MRFSLAWLLAFVLVCAVAVASLRFANEWWASTVFTATLATLSLGLVWPCSEPAILARFGPGSCCSAGVTWRCHSVRGSARMSARIC